MSKAAVKREQIVQHVTQHMIENGLADVGLRKLAQAAGTSDRMLIYYFETKDALIGQVLQGIAANLARQLDAVLGQHKRSAEALQKELLILSSSKQFDMIIRLWFEIVGFAVRGEEPYATSATKIAHNWIGWIHNRLENPQTGQATAVFAELEGKLMLKLIGVNLHPVFEGETT